MSKKILTDLAIRLTAQTAELQKQVEVANRSLTSIKTNTENLSGKISMGLAKIGGAFIAVKGSIEIFKTAMNSTEGSADRLDLIMGSLTGAIQGFFRTILTGDFANLIDNMVRTAKATRDLRAAMDEFEDEQASNMIKRGRLQAELESARLAAAGAVNKELKAQYIREAMDAQKSINSLDLEEARTKLKIKEDIFRGIMNYDQEYETRAIEIFRTIAENYAYYFGEGSVAMEGIKQRIADLQYKGKIQPLAPGENQELNRLKLFNSVFEDYVFLQNSLKPGEMNEYKKAVAEFFDVTAAGDQSLIKLEKSLTTTETALAKIRDTSQDAANNIKAADISNIQLPDLKPEIKVPDLAGAPAAALTPWQELNKSFEEAGFLVNALQIGLNGVEGAFTDMLSGSKGALKGMITAVMETAKVIINVFLAEAIAGMIAGESSKGIIGLITASVGISALLALWKTKVPEFAGGGLVYSPVNALVGEYPGASNNPEVIAPLDKLKDLIGGGMNGGRVRFEIDGYKLVGFLDKMNRINNIQ